MITAVNDATLPPDKALNQAVEKVNLTINKKPL
jgi:hypothetical protein